MADEMLRIAGRGTDGLAKAIKTNNNGLIETIVSNNDGDRNALIIKKALEEQTFNKNDIFFGSNGYNNFEVDPDRSEGNTNFNSGINLGHLMLETLPSDTNRNISTIVSKTPILQKGRQGVRAVIEYSLETMNNRSVFVRAMVRDAKNHADRTASNVNSVLGAGLGKRLQIEVDMTTLSTAKDLYLELSLDESSSSNPANAKLKIHHIYVLTSKGTLPDDNTGGGGGTGGGGTGDGSLSVKDRNGNYVDLTAELDDDGKAVMRVFDAAPHNQDSITDSLKTLNQTKVRMDEVFSDTLPANSEKIFSVKFENESKVWVHINASKSGWRLYSGTIRIMDGGKYSTFYPSLDSDQEAFPSGRAKIVRWLGVTSGAGNTQLPTEIENIHDAEAWAIPPGNHTISFVVVNNNSEPNDIEVLIVREWS